MDKRVKNNILYNLRVDVFGLSASKEYNYKVIDTLDNNYYCRYYGRYFKLFALEIFDLSKEEVLGLSREETIILRMRYGILSNGKKVSVKYIASILNCNVCYVSSKLRKISSELKRKLVIYGFDNFIIDVKEDNFDLGSIKFKELFPFDSDINSFYGEDTINKLCCSNIKFYDYLCRCGANVVIASVRNKAISQRVNLLMADGDSIISDDYIYSRHISCLSLDENIINILESKGIYTISALYLFDDLQNFCSIRNIGVAKMGKIIEAMLNFDMNLLREKRENTEEISGDIEKIELAIDCLMGRRENLLSELASIEEEISKISSFRESIMQEKKSLVKKKIREGYKMS